MQVLRLAQLKQTLRRKASALFGVGQREGRAARHDALMSSVPETDAVQRGASSTADVVAEEVEVTELVGDEVRQEHRSANIESAYPSTSRNANLALLSQAERAPEGPITAPSASPAASWIMTPASKIGVRESEFRRRASFRTLTYDPSIPLVYLDDKEGEITVNREPQQLQTAETLLSHAQAGRTYGISYLGGEDGELKAHIDLTSPSNYNSPNATSSAIFPSKLDSDDFDAALTCQATSKNTTQVLRNTSSPNTFLIHSDAIFLPSALETKTSSAIPSSESQRRGKGEGNGDNVRSTSTIGHIAQILQTVEAERDGLAAQKKGMREALGRAEREIGGSRAEIARMKRGNVE